MVSSEEILGEKKKKKNVKHGSYSGKVGVEGVIMIEINCLYREKICLLKGEGNYRIQIIVVNFVIHPFLLVWFHDFD